MFREHMTSVLKAVAEQFARDLQPADRKVAKAPDTNQTPTKDSKGPKKKEKTQDNDDLPAPD